MLKQWLLKTTGGNANQALYRFEQYAAREALWVKQKTFEYREQLALIDPYTLLDTVIPDHKNKQIVIH